MVALVSVKVATVSLDVNGLSNASPVPVCFPIQDLDIVPVNGMTFLGGMFSDRR